MSRSRRRNNTSAASLFPFLAVLLSTMGVLVVLLVAMASVQRDQALVQHTKAQPAEQTAQAKAPVHAEDKTTTAAPVKAEEPVQAEEQAQQAIADAESRRQQLATWQRRKEEGDQAAARQQQQLQRAEQRVAHLEENIRRRQDQLDQLRIAIHELQQLDEQHSFDQQQAEQRLADLQQQIRDAEKLVEELTEEQAHGGESYAILPFKGPNGTHRRPLYIECLADRVVLQPEGIELKAADFPPQQVSGSPLAAAIRAARKYYQSRQSAEAEQAYPLILVRPDGIISHQAVLQVLNSWDSPYGYEMVDADWKLDCGPANPELTLEIATAVDNARERIARLAQSAPRVFADLQQQAAQVSSLPGQGQSIFDAYRTRAASDVGSQAANSHSSQQGGPRLFKSQQLAAVLAAAQPSNSSRNSSRSRYSDTAQGYGQHAGNNGGAPPGPSTAPGSSTASALPASAFSGATESVGHYRDGATTPSHSPMAEQMAEPVAMNGLTADGSPSASSPSHDATPNGSRSDSSSATDRVASASGTAGTNGSGSSCPNPAAGGQSTAASGSGSMGGATASMGAPTSGSGSGGTSSSRQSPGSGMAIMRPIRVLVRLDRLVVLSEQLSHHGPENLPAGKVVLLQDNAQQATQEFEKAIHDRVADWGFAGQGAYWKPTLILTAAPGAEDLAANMAQALSAGGLEVQFPPHTAQR